MQIKALQLKKAEGLGGTRTILSIVRGQFIH